MQGNNNSTVDNYFRDNNEGNDIVFSKNYIDTAKFKDFVTYQCKKDVTLSVVKFQVSLRSTAENSNNPIEAQKDYYGAYNDHKWNEVDDLREKIQAVKEDNDNLLGQIDNLTEEIEIAKEEEIRRQEEEELKKKEEEDKNQKKGVKKR